MARTSLRDSDPTRIGRYRLTARIGAGGMGVVYLGVAEDGSLVAVKLLRPELADDPDFRRRFGREVSVLTRVRGVCTVRVIEADTESVQPFMVTEYAEGPSLAEYIDQHGTLGPDMLYGLATGLAEALTTIHAAGIVHRDLKPSNVLLTPGGPKVIDFGIAQALDTTSLTKTGITLGSAGFMAPEQIIGKAGTAADIFTWAVTVAYAASGQPPFGTGASDTNLYRIMHAEPDITAVPPGLHPLVEAALVKEPGDRPTAPQLLSQLTQSTAAQSLAVPSVGDGNLTQTILAQTWHPSATRAAAAAPHPTVPPPGTAPPVGHRSPRRRRALLPVVLTLAFLLAAGGTAVGFALAGGSGGNHGPASGSTTQTRPAQLTPATTHGTTTTPPTSPASSTTAPATTTPATTSPATTTPATTSPATTTPATTTPATTTTATTTATTPATTTPTTTGG